MSILTLRGRSFSPARFCAPMAGLTHSAFRRLVADFGGCGALFTEMLCGRWLRHEHLESSPAVKRRPHEGRVIYQLMITDAQDVPAILDRLALLQPDGVDLNCACPAPNVRQVGAGSELFEDRDRLAAILVALRSGYSGPLTVKIRLGSSREGWRDRLADRLRLFEDSGLDAVTLHPRFSEEKLRRRARHELLPEIAASTRLPLIASGDITGPQSVREFPDRFANVAGLMLGRMAVIRPWIFAQWEAEPSKPDYLEVWSRFARYVQEDFEPAVAFRRLKLFTIYFARNFVFGHTLTAAAQSAQDWETLTTRATQFLAADPAPDRSPSLQSLA